MGKLNDRLIKLESKIKSLESKIIGLTKNTEALRNKPESIVSQINTSQRTPMPSTGTGLGKMPGASANIIWNDADAQLVPWGQQPPIPSKGYNKHSHSEFSGGALDINTLKLVEYEFDGQNPDCQSYWKTPPSIKKDENGEEQISILADNMVWDKENKVWRFLAVYADDEEE